MAKRVIVVRYNEQWKTDFETIKQYLLTAIKDIIISIEHIGSTSVEGLSAKPIIDIDIVIKDYSVFDAVVEKLASLGYIHEGNLGIKDREAFDYQGDVDLPKHHLYVCPEFSAELHKHIAFRDYLKNNPEAVLKYSKVKEEGARLFPDSIDDYITYKSPCIEEIYKKCGLIKKVAFTKINRNEFKVFAKWSVKNYADNLIKSGDEKFRFKALKAAKSEFKDIFPDGADSADNYLYVIINENGEKIGVIGYQKSPFEENAAFVTENVIKEEYRRKGYGKRAFIKIQEDAKEKGFAKMVLNVFKHTPISYTMYEKDGFEVIEDYGGSVIMEKYFNNENHQYM